MSMLGAIRQSVRSLFQRHGSGISAVAKIAVKTLMPIGGAAVGGVLETLFDYANDKGNDVTDDQILSALGSLENDQAQLVSVLDILDHKLNDVFREMLHMQQFRTPAEGIADMLRDTMSRSPELQAAHAELMAIQGQLQALQAQGEAILREQTYAGDMLEDMKPQVEAVFGVFRGALADGVPERNALSFMARHAEFQQAFVQLDWPRAETLLRELEGLAPKSTVVLFFQAALHSVKAGRLPEDSASREFEVARGKMADAARLAPEIAILETAAQSLTHMTRGLPITPPTPPLGMPPPHRTTKALLLLTLPGQQPARFPLPGGITRIGRAPDNDLVLDDQHVSRHHLLIRRSRNHATLVNLAAPSATRLDGAPLPRKVETPLVLGRVLRLAGGTTVELVVE